jgi:hypothetical protein
VLFQPGALDRLASNREHARRQAPAEVLAATAAAVRQRLQEIWRAGIARGDAEVEGREDASGDDGAVGSALEPASTSRQLQQAAATSGSASEASGGSSAALATDEEGRWTGWLQHFFPRGDAGSSDETEGGASADQARSPIIRARCGASCQCRPVAAVVLCCHPLLAYSGYVRPHAQYFECVSLQEALSAGINLGGKKWYCYSRWVPPGSEDGRYARGGVSSGALRCAVRCW